MAALLTSRIFHFNQGSHSSNNHDQAGPNKVLAARVTHRRPRLRVLATCMQWYGHHSLHKPP